MCFKCILSVLCVINELISLWLMQTIPSSPPEIGKGIEIREMLCRSGETEASVLYVDFGNNYLY